MRNRIRRFAVERLMPAISVVMLILFLVDIFLSMQTNGEAVSLNSFLVFNRDGDIQRAGLAGDLIHFRYPLSTNIFFTPACAVLLLLGGNSG